MKRETIEKLLKENGFVLVTQNGIASKNMNRSSIMALLLYAYLEMWNEMSCYPVDIVDAATKVIELLAEMGDDEGDVFEMFLGNDEEGNG